MIIEYKHLTKARLIEIINEKEENLKSIKKELNKELTEHLKFVNSVDKMIKSQKEEVCNELYERLIIDKKSKTIKVLDLAKLLKIIPDLYQL